MIEYSIYFLANLIGYRLYHFDYALHRGIRLDSYSGWLFRPMNQKGTYREVRDGYEFKGYGTDK
jgi:hypothetical protein